MGELTMKTIASILYLVIASIFLFLVFTRPGSRYTIGILIVLVILSIIVNGG